MKTSNANVLRSSLAQSTRGIRSFFGSFLTAASGATLAKPNDKRRAASASAKFCEGDENEGCRRR